MPFRPKNLGTLDSIFEMLLNTWEKRKFKKNMAKRTWNVIAFIIAYGGSHKVDKVQLLLEEFWNSKGARSGT